MKETIVETPKKSAPNLIIGADLMRDERTGIVAELESKDPAFVYAFQSSAIAERPGELARRAQEVVKVNGEPMTVGGDVVVKIPRDRYTATRRHQENSSFEKIEANAAQPDEVRQTPHAKTPIARKEKAGDG